MGGAFTFDATGRTVTRRWTLLSRTAVLCGAEKVQNRSERKSKEEAHALPSFFFIFCCLKPEVRYHQSLISLSFPRDNAGAQAPSKGPIQPLWYTTAKQALREEDQTQYTIDMKSDEGATWLTWSFQHQGTLLHGTIDMQKEEDSDKSLVTVFLDGLLASMRSSAKQADEERSRRQAAESEAEKMASECMKMANQRRENERRQLARFARILTRQEASQGKDEPSPELNVQPNEGGEDEPEEQEGEDDNDSVAEEGVRPDSQADVDVDSLV